MNIQNLIKEINSKITESKSPNHVSMTVSLNSGNIVIDKLDRFWFSYEEGIEDISKDVNLKKYYEDIVFLFQYDDKSLNEVIDKVVEYLDEVYQGFGGYPDVALNLTGEKLKFKYRIFLEKIYYDLLHEDKVLYDPSVIKYLFDEEKTLINQ
ncbi:MAG: hypothetical protein WCK98_05735 [bacterium]